MSRIVRSLMALDLYLELGALWWWPQIVCTLVVFNIWLGLIFGLCQSVSRIVCTLVVFNLCLFFQEPRLTLQFFQSQSNNNNHNRNNSSSNNHNHNNNNNNNTRIKSVVCSRDTGADNGIQRAAISEGSTTKKIVFKSNYGEHPN